MLLILERKFFEGIALRIQTFFFVYT